MQEDINTQPDLHAPALPSRDSSLRKNAWLSVALIAIAFIGSANLLIRSSNFGLIVGHDSMHFLSAAENLAAGEGFRNYSFEPYVRWPPFYPGVLALIDLLGIDVLDGSRFLNIVTIGLIALVTGHWLSRRVQSRLLVVGAVAMIVVSYAINWVASLASSGILFILLTLLALTKLGDFLNQKTPIRSLALSVLFASLAILTRYLGIAITISAVILVLANKKLSVRKRFIYSAIYGTVSAIPIAAALVYSRVSFGHFTGRSSWITNLPVSASLGEIGDALYVWFYALEPGLFTVEPPNWMRFYLWMTAGIIVLSLLVFLYSRIWVGKELPINRVQRIDDDNVHISTFLPFAVFSFVYILILILVIPADVVVDPAYGTYRYLASLYVPILIVSVFLLERFLGTEFRGRTDVLKYALVALLIFGGAVHFNRVVRWNFVTTVRALEFNNSSNAYEYMRNGYGYTRNSPIIKYLHSNPLGGEIFTNKVIALFFATDIPPPVKSVPRGVEHPGNPYHLNLTPDPLRKAARNDIEYCLGWVNYIAESANPDEQKYIVYLTSDRFNNFGVCPLELISQSEHLELVVEKSDGVVYRVS